MGQDIIGMIQCSIYCLIYFNGTSSIRTILFLSNKSLNKRLEINFLLQDLTRYL